jgi:ElaB/YqjD/DUF883 family membrane-anchored ribosome-binding protein
MYDAALTASGHAARLRLSNPSRIRNLEDYKHMKAIAPDATKEKLLNEFNTVLAETEQLLTSVANASSDKAGALKANLEQGLASAGERLARIRDASREQAVAAARATDAYVQESPWRAIGIAAALAAAIGLAAGLLISRRE